MNCLPLMGDPDLIPYVARLAASNNAGARIRTNTLESLQFFQPSAMKEAIEQALDSVAEQSADTTHFERVRNAAKVRCGRWDEDIDEMLRGEFSEKKQLLYASFFRIYLPAHRLPEVRAFADTCSSEKVRTAMKEAIEWHRLAYTY